jgi:hypothetical protein
MCFSIPAAMSSMVLEGRGAVSAASAVQKGMGAPKLITHAKRRTPRAIIV